MARHAHDAIGEGLRALHLSRPKRVARGTIRRMEGFEGPVSARTETLDKIVAVLERAGVEFLRRGKAGRKARKEVNCLIGPMKKCPVKVNDNRVMTLSPRSPVAARCVPHEDA